MSDEAIGSPGADRPGRRRAWLGDAGRSSSDVIATALAERVLSDEFAEDDRLPSERRLAAEFGASRQAVREALRSLVERGLIDVEPGRGAFVRGDTGPRRFPPLDLEYRRRGTTARHLSEARLMLETEAAVLAARHADANDLAVLGRALERLEASTTPLDRVRNDLAFRAALVAASHNPVIETMFGSIQDLTVELMVRSAGDAETVRRSGPHHRRLLEAIADRNTTTARQSIREHLGIAASTHGVGYDQSLDTTALHALRLIGLGAGLEDFLRAALRGESDV